MASCYPYAKIRFAFFVRSRNMNDIHTMRMIFVTCRTKMVTCYMMYPALIAATTMVSADKASTLTLTLRCWAVNISDKHEMHVGFNKTFKCNLNWVTLLADYKCLYFLFWLVWRLIDFLCWLSFSKYFLIIF